QDNQDALNNVIFELLQGPAKEIVGLANELLQGFIELDPAIQKVLLSVGGFTAAFVTATAVVTAFKTAQIGLILETAKSTAATASETVAKAANNAVTALQATANTGLAIATKKATAAQIASAKAFAASAVTYGAVAGAIAAVALAADAFLQTTRGQRENQKVLDNLIESEATFAKTTLTTKDALGQQTQQLNGLQRGLDVVRKSLNLTTAAQENLRRTSLAFNQILRATNVSQSEGVTAILELRKGAEKTSAEVKILQERIQLSIDALKASTVATDADAQSRDRQIANLERLNKELTTYADGTTEAEKAATGLRKELESSEKAFTAQGVALLQSLAEREVNEEQFQQRSRDRELQFNQERLARQKALLAALLDNEEANKVEIDKLRESILATEKALAQSRIAINQAAEAETKKAIAERVDDIRDGVDEAEIAFRQQTEALKIQLDERTISERDAARDRLDAAIEFDQLRLDAQQQVLDTLLQNETDNADQIRTARSQIVNIEASLADKRREQSAQTFRLELESIDVLASRRTREAETETDRLAERERAIERLIQVEQQLAQAAGLQESVRQAQLNQQIRQIQLSETQLQREIDVQTTLQQQAKTDEERSRLGEKILQLQRDQLKRVEERQAKERLALEQQQNAAQEELARARVLAELDNERLRVANETAIVESKIAAIATETEIAKLNQIAATRELTPLETESLDNLERQLGLRRDSTRTLEQQQASLQKAKDTLEESFRARQELLDLANDTQTSERQIAQEIERQTELLETINVEGRTQAEIAEEVQQKLGFSADEAQAIASQMVQASENTSDTADEANRLAANLKRSQQNAVTLSRSVGSAFGGLLDLEKGVLEGQQGLQQIQAEISKLKGQEVVVPINPELETFDLETKLRQIQAQIDSVEGLGFRVEGNGPLSGFDPRSNPALARQLDALEELRSQTEQEIELRQELIDLQNKQQQQELQDSKSNVSSSTPVRQEETRQKLQTAFESDIQQKRKSFDEQRQQQRDKFERSQDEIQLKLADEIAAIDEASAERQAEIKRRTALEIQTLETSGNRELEIEKLRVESRVQQALAEDQQSRQRIAEEFRDREQQILKERQIRDRLEAPLIAKREALQEQIAQKRQQEQKALEAEQLAAEKAIQAKAEQAQAKLERRRESFEALLQSNALSFNNRLQQQQKAFQQEIEAFKDSALNKRLAKESFFNQRLQDQDRDAMRQRLAEETRARETPRFATFAPSGATNVTVNAPDNSASVVKAVETLTDVVRFNSSNASALRPNQRVS
ncbi:MAG: hypothetical protein AAFY15_00595, partial [Cyanobacteria bacterium J06648_11]